MPLANNERDCETQAELADAYGASPRALGHHRKLDGGRPSGEGAFGSTVVPFRSGE